MGFGIYKIVPVAQPDRASDFGSEGWGFESLQARASFQATYVRSKQHDQLQIAVISPLKLHNRGRLPGDTVNNFWVISGDGTGTYYAGALCFAVRLVLLRAKVTPQDSNVDSKEVM